MTGADDDEDDSADLGERPVSDHPNFVTPEGLALIERHLARGQAAHDTAQAAGDRAALRLIERDLRYWMNRRANAQVVEAPRDATRVHFGSTATLALASGRSETWRIVGEDEAAPACGSLAYVSPLAQALIGRRLGEVVRVLDESFEIVAIS